MEKITITAEQLLRAKDYVPVALKTHYANEAANFCFDRLNLKLSGGPDSLPMPPMYKENTELKFRMLMGGFVKMYLGMEFETETEASEDASGKPIKREVCPWLMTQEAYDLYAGSHIFNQIERLKSEYGEVRDRAFDILADWRTTEKMLNAEISGKLMVMNEPVSRILMATQLQTTPEVMQELQKELENVQKEMEAYKKERERAVLKK